MLDTARVEGEGNVQRELVAHDSVDCALEQQNHHREPQASQEGAEDGALAEKGTRQPVAVHLHAAASGRNGDGGGKRDRGLDRVGFWRENARDDFDGESAGADCFGERVRRGVVAGVAAGGE